MMAVAAAVRRLQVNVHLVGMHAFGVLVELGAARAAAHLCDLGTCRINSSAKVPMRLDSASGGAGIEHQVEGERAPERRQKGTKKGIVERHQHHRQECPGQQRHARGQTTSAREACVLAFEPIHQRAVPRMQLLPQAAIQYAMTGAEQPRRSCWPGWTRCRPPQA